MAKREIKIYCPKCSWMPLPASRWSCACKFAWNTFDTGGVCPKCSKVWSDTQCLACQRWSPHALWYHDFIDGTEQLAAEEIAPAEQPLGAP